MTSEFIVPPHVPSHPKVDKVLGGEWLKHKVEDAIAATKGKASLHPSRMSPTFGWVVHPLVSEAKQKVVKSKATPILDSLEIDLTDLGSTALPNDLRERLRDEHDFSKAAYELRIAAGFRRLGYYPIWCPPIKHPHPEFLILEGETNVLSVEYKKRDTSDGYEKQAGKFWKHLQYELRRGMSERSLNYWVKLSGRLFDLADIEPLVSEILSTIETTESGKSTAINGRYHFEFVKLADPGGNIDMDVVNMFPRGDFGINMGQRYRTMVGPLKDPKLLRMEFWDDPEQRVRGVVRNLKTAAKQVLEGLPNLVYIDVNIPSYEQEQAEFGSMVDAVENTLTAGHRRVSAVVLTNIFPALSLDEYLGWRVRTELVTQPKPTAILPKGAWFPGNVSSTGWLRGRLSRPVS